MRTAFFLKNTMILVLAAGVFSCSSEKKEEQPKEEETSYATDAYPSEETEKKEVDPMKNKGVGPVKSVTLGESIDKELAAKGKTLFEAKCTACHKFDQKYVGPALGGLTEIRSPEWIMNMILNPVEMTQKDPIAQDLLATYTTQMTFQDVTKDEARAIVEYFRTQKK